jgi:DNA-binding transcriptional LysR family regulator
MKRLEEELGCSLFTPSGRNIVPTREAKTFYVSSGQVLQAIENAKKAIKQNVPMVRELKVATFEVFSTHFMAWMIEQQALPYPVTLIEAVPGQIEKRILEGEVDYGLTYMPELHPDLDHGALGEMPLGVFVAKRARSKELPFVVPITELGIHHLPVRSLDGWPADIPRDIQFRFEMLETALDLVSRGRARILCPKFLVAIENERLNEEHQMVELEQKLRFPRLKVYAVKRKSDPEGDCFKKICKAVRMALRTG